MASIEVRVEEIKKVPALAYLSESDLRTLAQAAVEKEFKKGDVLLEEGSTGSEVYVIVRGQCDVVSGGKPVAVIDAHQFVGEMAVISPERRSATVTARTDGVAYVISGFDFRSTLQANPKMALQLIKGLTTRLRNAQSEIAQLKAELASRSHDGDGANDEPGTPAPKKKRK